MRSESNGLVGFDHDSVTRASPAAAVKSLTGSGMAPVGVVVDRCGTERSPPRCTHTAYRYWVPLTSPVSVNELPVPV